MIRLPHDHATQLFRGPCRSREQISGHWRKFQTNEGNGGILARRRAHLRVQPLAATHYRHRLHVDDRQSSIRLDAVRQSDQRQVPVGHGFDPGRIHHFRAHRNLAGAGRGLPRGQVRPGTGHRGRGASGRPVVGVELGRGLAFPALSGCRPGGSAQVPYTAPASVRR